MESDKLIGIRLTFSPDAGGSDTYLTFGKHWETPQLSDFIILKDLIN
jgi:hypothetical protein